MSKYFFILFFILLLPIVYSYDTTKEIKLYGSNDLETDKLRTYFYDNNINYTFIDMKNITNALNNPTIKNIPVVYIDGVKYTEFNINMVKDLEPTTYGDIAKKSAPYLLIGILLFMIANFIYTKYNERYTEYK